MLRRARRGVVRVYIKLTSPDDEILLETELEVLNGVNNVRASFPAGEVNIEFDETQISWQEILDKIESIGFPPEGKISRGPKEVTYFVKGMHCASCEVLIENKLLKGRGIKAVEASTARGSVTIEYEEGKPTA